MTYITLTEAARRLHICRPTLYYYERCHGLPIDRSQPTPRIKVDALARWRTTFTPPSVGRPAGRNPFYKAKGANIQRRAELRAKLAELRGRPIAEQAQVLGLSASYVKKLRSQLKARPQ